MRAWPKERLLALRYPNEIVDDVTKLVYLHLRFHTYRMGWTDSAVRRYVHDAGDLLDELNELTRCDCTTRNARKATGARHGAWTSSKRASPCCASRRSWQDPPRSRRQRGDGVPRLPPGPVVGEALGFLLEIRLDEGPIGKDAAYRRLAEWAAAHGIELAG